MPFRIALVIVTALLIAAHFLRNGGIILTLLSALSPLLLLIRKRWVLYLLQTCAYLSAAVWASTAIELIRGHIAEGRSWTASAIILGAVTVLTIFAGLSLNSAAFKNAYPE